MDEAGLSLRELVLEVRADVKALGQRIDAIDRTGSIGTREELTDHEQRLRVLERGKWGIAGMGSILGAAAGVLTAMFGPHP